MENHVLATTGTIIGVEIAQNPANAGTPHAKLGYNRSEFAYVPTNRQKKEDGTASGAEESTDVIMELKYSGLFSFGSDGGIYQRLAVGKNAVASPGAAVMFLRANDGTVPSPQAVKDVSDAVNKFNADNPPPE